MYNAEIINADGKILVKIISSTSKIRFSRLFYNICDAEYWLIGLARNGLTKRARQYLVDPELVPAELAALGPIVVSDRRTVKRIVLPSKFE
jgi:hypothetical protein